MTNVPGRSQSMSLPPGSLPPGLNLDQNPQEAKNRSQSIGGETKSDPHVGQIGNKSTVETTSTAVDLGKINGRLVSKGEMGKEISQTKKKIVELQKMLRGAETTFVRMGEVSADVQIIKNEIAVARNRLNSLLCTDSKGREKFSERLEKRFSELSSLNAAANRLASSSKNEILGHVEKTLSKSEKKAPFQSDFEILKSLEGVKVSSSSSLSEARLSYLSLTERLFHPNLSKIQNDLGNLNKMNKKIDAYIDKRGDALSPEERSELKKLIAEERTKLNQYRAYLNDSKKDSSNRFKFAAGSVEISIKTLGYSIDLLEGKLNAGQVSGQQKSDPRKSVESLYNSLKDLNQKELALAGLEEDAPRYTELKSQYEKGLEDLENQLKDVLENQLKDVKVEGKDQSPAAKILAIIAGYKNELYQSTEGGAPKNAEAILWLAAMQNEVSTLTTRHKKALSPPNKEDSEGLASAKEVGIKPEISAEEKAKSEKLFAASMNELKTTEQTYNKGLANAIKLLKGLSNEKFSGKSAVSNEVVMNYLRTLEEIKEKSDLLLKTLNREPPASITEISTAIKTYLNDTKELYKKTTRHYSEVLEAARDKDLGKAIKIHLKADLASVLVLPVQRASRYALTLKEVDKHAKNLEPEIQRPVADLYRSSEAFAVTINE